MNSDPRRAAADLLAFYREAGVEDALDETAHDRFAEPATLPSPRSRGEGGSRSEPGEGRINTPTSIDTAPHPSPLATPRIVPGFSPGTGASPSPRERGEERAPPERRPAKPAPASPDAAVADARARSRSAATLEELRALMESFEGCELKRTAYRLVFGDGNPEARLMFIGEGPGGEEDRQGKPFVGRSGQLLDRMLAAIGLDRTKVYIANVVPWRPPGNRTPTPAEIAICQPFIARQIELVNPDVLVCVGLPSAQTLLGIREGILKSRGRWMTYRMGERDILAMATLHPAYLLRTPSQKKLAWRDFKLIRAALRKSS